MGGTTFVLQHQSVVLALAMALAFALSAQTAEGALTFLNKLPYGLFLYHPPGCCSPFGFHPPPPGYGCAKCPIVYLAPNVSNTLDPIVGPYPLQFLKIIGRYGKTYCVVGKNLNATNTMTIGPKGCDHGVEAQILETGKSKDFGEKYCLKWCI